ncbi:hypothetical protein HJC23_004091 [Cyclotella cryptica]|uniref:Uncharacterized protein n=1 Tax=Cyclotella cryptica TaxID=29204 RepID=A0ABD3P346_9STRA|eukprot:CCRYP_018216-RC/>CCRYP_018216-RC protein AED:0.10 eAED:0.10 QI:55/1/1/1/0.83/0.71/7/2472/2170
MSGPKHEISTIAEERASPCSSSRCSATPRQIDVLENNFKFYHAWTPHSFEELESSSTQREADSTDSSNANTECICGDGTAKSKSVADSILVMALPSISSDGRSIGSSSLSAFFSAFGPVSRVDFTTDKQTKETIGLVKFEDGSDGAQKVIDSQPIKMFGKVLNIKMATGDNLISSSHEHASQQNTHNSPKNKKSYAFPLMVAPPNYGPWYQKPPQKSYLKSSNMASPPERRKRTMGKWAAAASKIITVNFNPPSTEIISDPTTESFHHAKNLRKHGNTLSQKTPSASLHALLSPSVRDPLFDDYTDVMGDSYGSPVVPEQRLVDHADDEAQRQPEKEGVKYYHFDQSLPSWVWAPITARRSDGDEADDCTTLEHGSNFSVAERDLHNTLKLGRASHATLPLLSMVSCPNKISQPSCPKNKGEGSNYLLETNLPFLHKAIDIKVTNNSTGKQTGSYTLYQARHPCLAPLISVTKCSDCSAMTNEGIKNESKNGMESFVSVFDITPSRHRSLHELLRTGDFLSKPLYPGITGHVSEDEYNKNRDNKQYKRLDLRSPLAWFHTRDDYLGLCRCHTIFDRGRSSSFGSQSNIPHRDRNFRAELRQFTSSTSTMFSAFADQEIFDDLRRFHVLPPSSSHHPQLYSRFNQTRMLYKVGTAYHADVADLRIRFLALQLFHAVNFFHSKGLTLGDQLRPDRIFIENDWVRLVAPIASAKNNEHARSNKGFQNMDSAEGQLRSLITPLAAEAAKAERRFIFNRYGNHHAPSEGHSIDNNEESCCHESPEIIPYPGYGLMPVAQWQKGQLTNFAYLMLLNAAAGRTVGDQKNPPILPWVTDFTAKIDLESELVPEDHALSSPWRDLTKTKYRLHKGDEQLDQSYLHASPAHHVPETISDLTYTVYRARCLPLIQLKAKVRNLFVPEHYPNSLERLYQWTPDEATHEFYTHSWPDIFKSRHKEMEPLRLPEWCKSSAEFISYHRQLLESDEVSQRLHSWIDLNFGVALSGERAVLEKNVVLHNVQWNCGRLPHRQQCLGECHSSFPEKYPTDDIQEQHICTEKFLFVQLFLRPHPRKILDLESNSTILIPPTSTEMSKSVKSREFLLRKQRDLSLIGAILAECYSSAKVIPEPNVETAIDSLLLGELDLKHTLLQFDDDQGISRDGTFPFPASFRQVYSFLSGVQNTSFTRDKYDPVKIDTSDLTLRSTDLERAWNTIKNAVLFESLSSASCALALPTLLNPISSIRFFMENYEMPRPYVSFADKLSSYVVQLSKVIPGGVMMAHVLKFLSNSSRQAHDDLVIHDAIGKLYLSRELISSMYMKCSWEEFIEKISDFITSQFHHFSTMQHISKKATNQLDVRSIAIFFTTSLARDDILGSSVYCRYVVPLLLRGVENCPMRVQALRNVLPFLPEESIGVIIVKPILKLLCQKSSLLIAAETGKPSPQLYRVSLDTSLSVIPDLISLLHACLSQMESELVVKHYFQSSTPGCILHILLLSFGATVSGHRCHLKTAQFGTSQEVLDECLPRDILKSACLLVRSMIQKFETRHMIETLFPIIEAFCSKVNDAYLGIPLKQSTNLQDEVFATSEYLLLPGIDDACMIVKEVKRVCDESLLEHHCPSALELLSWVNSPVAVGRQPTKKPVTINKNIFTSDRPTAADVSVLRAVIDDVLPGLSDNSSPLLSSQAVVGDEEIEMLGPRRAPTEDADDDSEDDGLVSSATGEQPIEREDISVQKNTASSLVEQCDMTKQKRDLAWVMGLHKLDQDEVKYLWQPRMMATTTLPVDASVVTDGVDDTDRGIITCLAPNQSESMVIVGNSLGEMILFDLRRHPPTLTYRKRIENDGNVKAITQVGFFNAENILACNGGLHLWDAETGNLISFTSACNTFLSNGVQVKPWKDFDLIRFSTFPAMTSLDEIVYAGYGEVAAISSSHLYMIDMRCDSSVVGQLQLCEYHKTRQQQVDPMMRYLTWYLNEPPTTHPSYQKKRESTFCLSSFNLKCITAHCGGGDWVCVGSSSGHIHCFDRRGPKLLVCWKAHTNAVEYLQAVSRHCLLSVSADKTAVLWDLSKSQPRKISSIYNIPGKADTMNVAFHQFQSNGLVSIPGKGQLLLCAASGRKAVFQSMPIPRSEEEFLDVKADRIVMSDYEGSRISRSRKFGIHSIALLPCRQLVLLGCEDGIHVCL